MWCVCVCVHICVRLPRRAQQHKRGQLLRDRRSRRQGRAPRSGSPRVSPPAVCARGLAEGSRAPPVPLGGPDTRSMSSPARLGCGPPRPSQEPGGKLPRLSRLRSVQGLTVPSPPRRPSSRPSPAKGRYGGRRRWEEKEVEPKSLGSHTARVGVKRSGPYRRVVDLPNRSSWTPVSASRRLDDPAHTPRSAKGVLRIRRTDQGVRPRPRRERPVLTARQRLGLRPPQSDGAPFNSRPPPRTPSTAGPSASPSPTPSTTASSPTTTSSSIATGRRRRPPATTRGGATSPPSRRSSPPCGGPNGGGPSSGRRTARGPGTAPTGRRTVRRPCRPTISPVSTTCAPTASGRARTSPPSARWSSGARRLSDRA